MIMPGHWRIFIALSLTIAIAGCRSKPGPGSALNAVAMGAALVESSGGKQIGATGTVLAQPLVVQVNDEKGTAVVGALVEFSAPTGVRFDPPSGLTDSNGQLATKIALGGIAGRYQITVLTPTIAHKFIELKIEETALGYQQQAGLQLSDKYCARCHEPESSPERVSNFDNLAVKPHPFTDGDALNKMSDPDLIAIVSHGGSALNKSPLMPLYGDTLSKTEIEALIAYIRMVSDSPNHASEIVYAQK